MCHIVLLLPIISLPVFWLLPPGISVPLYIFILFVTGLMYYLVFKAMHRPIQCGIDELIGQKANVSGLDSHDFFIRINGEIWKIESKDKIHINDAVEIVGNEGLKLKVRKQKKNNASEILQHEEKKE